MYFNGTIGIFSLIKNRKINAAFFFFVKNIVVKSKCKPNVINRIEW